MLLMVNSSFDIASVEMREDCLILLIQVELIQRYLFAIFSTMGRSESRTESNSENLDFDSFFH